MKINHDDEKMIFFLQKYIPIILNSEIYFQKLIRFMLKKINSMQIKRILEKIRFILPPYISWRH